ncbi:MAG: Rpn family recombination-promoting nuclease/putative transposase [Fibrobacter sp.]|nr:Rpn family recombination-promoting nuclease/putative transposase [Fibrobacter sp.]
MSSLDVSLNNDFLFCSIFGDPHNEKMLCSLINSVMLNKGLEPVLSAKVLNPIHYGFALGGKRSVLDIKAKSHDDTLFNLEMQVKWNSEIEDRFMFYLATTYRNQLERGGVYTQLKPCHSIAFLNYTEVNVLHDYVRTISDESNRCKQILNLHAIEMPLVKKVSETSSLLEKWVYFINNLNKQGDTMIERIKAEIPEAADAYQQYIAFTSDKKIMEQIERMAKWESDYATNMYYAGVEGEAKGEARGKAEGEAQKQREMVQSIHAEGFDIATIARIAKITEAEVQQIIASAKK